jgi:hypothetical protein
MLTVGVDLSASERSTARAEGWIHLPREGCLAQLATPDQSA